MRDDKQKIELVTVTDLADYFGRDVRTIQLWVEDGMPKLARGKYNKDACIKWRIKKLEDALQIANSTGDETLTEEKQKAYRLKNFGTLMDLDEKAGRLASAQNVELVMGYFVTTTNSSLDYLMNDVLTMVRDEVDKKILDSIKERFNDVKGLLNTLEVKDKLTRDDSLLDENFILSKKEGEEDEP